MPVMIVGEDEFAIQSKQVDRILKLSGLSRADFAFATCNERLFDRIRTEKPSAILAFGNTPLEILTGKNGISRFRGYVLEGPQNTKVIGTFHPSFLLPRKGQKSTSHYTPAVIRDIKQAINIGQNGWALPVPHYLEDVSPSEAVEFYKDYISGTPCPLSIDIETPYKLSAGDEEEFEELDTQILRIGYCFRPGYAMSIPFTTEYFHIHKALLQTPWKKVWWNGYHFDIPIIEEVMGMKVNGVQIDAMWAWHHLQPDLPRGLESVGSYYFVGLPWKHLSKDSPAKYNCIDVDCALQNWLGVEAALKKNGQLEGFYELVVDLDPVLKEAGNNGVRIDKQARRKLYKKLRKEENKLLKAIQPLVPEVLKPTKRYKRFPSVHEHKRTIREVTTIGKTKMCQVCGVCGVTKTQHTSRKGGKKGVPLNPCYKAEIIELEGDVIEWDVVLDFNPSSPKQLISYLEHFGLPIGKNPKTGAPTVDDDHMEMLIKRHGNEFPILSFIRELRTVSKSISTYVKGLKPNEKGVVQTQYTYAPATGRLSSKGLQRGSDRGVNLQNIPHRGDHPYASEIRKMIIPHEGFVFVEADSSAIEAVIVGYLMGGKDDPYVKMAQRGIHDAFSLYSRGEELTDENIAKFKKLAKVQGSEEMIMRDRKKRTVHACLTPGHKVLTPQGWKAIEHLTEHEPIAQWQEGNVSFVIPRRLIKEPHAGDVVVLQGRGLSVEMTPDHRVPVQTPHSNTVRTVTATDLCGRQRIPVSGELQPQVLHERSLFACLAVAVQADAAVSEYETRFHLVKSRKIKRLRVLLKECGIHYTEVPCQKCKHIGCRITILHKDMPEQIWQYVSKTREKLFNLSTMLGEDLRALVEESTYWDGSRGESTRYYFTTVKHNAEVLQTLAHLSGKQALLRSESAKGKKTHYKLSYNRRQFAHTTSLAKSCKEYVGDVYCVTVPSGFFLIKHGDRISVTGNCNYDEGPGLITKQYPKEFPTFLEAKREVAAYHSFVPGLKKWHHATRVQANETHYLQLPFGNYRRYFYNVFDYVRDKDGKLIVDPKTKKPKIKLGEDGKSCIAQRPQGSAAMFMRQNALKIATKIKAEMLNFRLPGNFLVHDSYCLEVPDNEWAKALAVQILKNILTRPIPEMDGLQIGCEIKIGKNWDEMEVVKI